MYLLCQGGSSRGLSNRMVLACLLHDASECYMSDVPTPFKNELPEYQEQEEHLLGIIYEKFLGSDLTEEEQKELKKIDHAMLGMTWNIYLEKYNTEKFQSYILT